MNGPFQGNKSGIVIAKFVKDELFPLLDHIRDLSISVSQLKVGFFDSFLRIALNKQESSYKDLSVKFITMYKKWNMPDLLYKEVKIDTNNPLEFGPAMNDYFNSQQAVMWHFNEGFRLLSYIDSVLTEQSTASYNRISVSLSLIAIVISVFLGIILKK